MINTPTTFILGAGASHPYGFPTGDGLKKEIIEKHEFTVDEPNDSRNQMVRKQLIPHIHQMVEALKLSGRSSIDAFLERRSDFIDIGTNAIATHLCEHESRIFHPDIYKDDWYQWLFNWMFDGFDSFADNRASFVTFNYDRSLELVFTSMLANTEGRTLEDAWEVVHKLPIIHVYGKLDASVNLAAQDSGVPVVDTSPQSVLRAKKGIRIISDHRIDEGDKLFLRARQAIRGAKRVIFLGFGYDQTNLKRIGIDPSDPEWKEAASQIKLWGTAFCLRQSEIDVAFTNLGGGISFADTDCDCLEFLRRCIRTDS